MAQIVVGLPLLRIEIGATSFVGLPAIFRRFRVRVRLRCEVLQRDGRRSRLLVRDLVGRRRLGVPSDKRQRANESGNRDQT